MQKKSEESGRYKFLSEQIKEKENVIQDLKDKNKLLQGKKIVNVAPASGARDINTASIEVSVPTQYNLPKDKSEAGLYTFVLESYRENNFSKLTFAKNALTKNYPRSIYIDNAIYLMGIMELNQEHYGEAIKYFNQIIEQHVDGNKRVSAFFAKAVAYKKLNLNDFARQGFKQVVKIYPGSSEALRASMELKILSASFKQGRQGKKL